MSVFFNLFLVDSTRSFGALQFYFNFYFKLIRFEVFTMEIKSLLKCQTVVPDALEMYCLLMSRISANYDAFSFRQIIKL